MNVEYSLRLEKIEQQLLLNLPETFNTSWLLNSFSTLPKAIKPNHIAYLTKPALELLVRGGKRWRSLLMVLACELAGGQEKAYPLVPLIEFAHTASLIHDDIEDHAETRRGKPAIHLMFGEDTSINSGSWLYFHAFSVIDSFSSEDTTKLLLYKTATRDLRRLHLGQAMDIAWHREPRFIPTQTEYTAMVTMKTGTLARIAGELGMIVGGKTEEEANSFGNICAQIGVGFQVLDDVIKLTTGNLGKKRGDDIVEGKKSLPVLYHLEKNPQDIDFFSDGFSQARKEGINSPMIETLIKKMDDSGAITKAKDYGYTLIKQSCESIREQYQGAKEAELIAQLFESMLFNLN